MTKDDILKRIENAKEKVAADMQSMFDGLRAEVSKAIDEAKELSWQEGYKECLKSIGQTPVNTEDDEPVKEAEYVLTNPMVAAFMLHKYPDNILTTGKSVVNDYISRYVVENDYANNAVEHPLPVNIGTPSDDVYLKGGGHVYQGKGGQIFNLAPNRTYEGTVGGKAVKLRTVGTVCQIHFEADSFIPNCRDIGGYKAEGGTVKYRRILRSAELPTIKKDSSLVKVMKDLAVTCEIDLRGEHAYNDLGWRGYAIGINGYAQAITSPTKYKEVFERVLKEVKSSGCVILHCHAGADRTGTIVALLLALLGVSASDICKDYELTCACHWCNFKRIDDERFAEFSQGELRSAFKKLASLYGTKGESLQQQAYSWWTKKVGITAQQVSDFKKAMIG